MTQKIRIAIVGFGNLGRGVKKAIHKFPDLELVQIITRRPDAVREEVNGVEVFSFEDFKPIADVAILCGGSKEDIFGASDEAVGLDSIPEPHKYGHGPFFAQYFNTVDSFDTHKRIATYHKELGRIAKANKHSSVICAGWDPGTFSLARVLADAFLPDGKVYTFWGPGVSQGHSDAVRQVPGVLDARSYTVPIKRSLAEIKSGKNPDLKPEMMHKRVVYVVAEDGAVKKSLAKSIKTMPNYFQGYRTSVHFISKKELEEHHKGFPHCGSVIVSGQTSPENKALIEYHCEWGSNPEATAHILLACARACFRLAQEQRYGAFTMLEIPPFYYSARSLEELLQGFV